jgi:penicillin-insensitive murein endopeptidase
MGAGTANAGDRAGRSISIKNASDGYLVNGKALPVRGKFHRVMARTYKPGQHYGTDELVGLLKRASKRVAKQFPKSVMLVGNLSKKAGGDLVGSVSHNSGRDADIAFYVKRSDGRRVTSPGFLRFSAAGRSAPYSFDVARNWAFVAAVLSDSRVQVQWMFVSTGLRKLMLEHARESGAKAKLIERASEVLGQPGNSSAHSEHFHLRLYCALHERLEGCLNYGTTHAWIDDYAREIETLSKALAADFSHSDTEKALTAIKKVGAIRGHTAVASLASRLGDERAVVRSQILKTLMLLKGSEAAVPALLEAFEKSQSDNWRVELLQSLGEIGSPRAAAAFMKTLNAGAGLSLMTAGIEGLKKLVWTPAVPALIEQIAHPKKAVRDASFSALRFITNHHFGRGRGAHRKWKKWQAVHGGKDRISWVKAGFERRYRIGLAKNKKRAITRLIRLIYKGGAVAFNAQALIKELTGFSVDRAHFSNRQMYRFYMTWLRDGMPRGDTKRSTIPGG